VPFPWWQFFFPGLILFFFAIAVNFLSDGLRDALDPRLRR
jgi:ABC-type dipeptide/oligopeptide/nickel transport system permease subunit